jgi:hypothetical protein
MPFRRWFAWWLVPAACGLLGCAGDNRRGGSLPGPPPPPGSTAVAPLPPAAPGPVSSTSPAALAQGGGQPLDPEHNLRIGAPPTAGQPGWQTPPATEPPPRPIFATPTRASAGPRPVVVPAASAQVASYEQAQAFLASRGVKWQRLETWGDSGEWKFSCSVPNPQNTFISRTYEARADTYLAAVRAVLEQMQMER